MKLKGISVFEQHAEKVVLLVFALFAIGVFVMQFDLLGPTNAVEIKGKTVRPEQAGAEVRRRAQSIKGQMEAGGEGLEVPNPPGVLVSIEEAMRGRVMPESMAPARLSSAWSGNSFAESPSSGSDSIAGNELDNPYVEVRPPAPVGVSAYSFAGTIDPLEAARHPELAALLPSEQPYDKRAVSVEGTFDVASLRAMLERVPDDRGVNPLPRQWWERRVEILDVEIIRQEVYADGMMGGEESLPGLAGRFSMRERLNSEATAPRDLPSLLADERSQREEIRRPSFYGLISGEPWVWPSSVEERAEAHPNAAEIALKVTRYRSLVGRREQREQAIARIQGMPDERDEKRDGGRSPRGDASDGLGGRWPVIPPTWLAQGELPGKPRGGGNDQDDRKRRRERAQLNNLIEQVERLTEEIEELEAYFAEQGVDTNGSALKTDGVTVFVEALTSLTGTDAPETVTVWGHDVTVEPGRSYRYKMRVWVTNPLFGNGAQVPASQRELAMEPAVASADSEWSNVVGTFPERVYFVSSALGADEIGGGLRRDAQASVSVYEFFYGYWRGGSASLRRGDQVRVEVELPELPVWTVESSEDTEPRVEGDPTMLPTVRTIGEGSVLVEVGVGLSSLGEVHEVIFGRLVDGVLEIRVAEVDSESALAWAVRSSSERGMEAEVGVPGGGSAKGRRPGRRGPEGEEHERDRRGRQPMIGPGAP